MSDPLGDGVSSVELTAHMGDDLMVVNAARVSLAKQSDWLNNGTGQESLSVKDARLIAYLARNGHWTPFSQPQLQFRIKMPIFVARQWYKHQIGFTRNETSRRYVDERPQIYMPTEWRLRAESVKQGSSSETRKLEHDEHAPLGEIIRVYLNMVANGIAPEMARMILPQSTYTEFIETASLYAYARLYRLRTDEHAQLETQLYAAAVGALIAPLFPKSWAALCG